jgi:hypothetical protein
MGWKSTITITRSQAIGAIMQKILDANDSELADILDNLVFGDNSDLPWYGYNFQIVDKLAETDDEC